MDDDAQRVGIGDEETDLLREKFGLLLEPGGNDPDHLVPDLQRGAEVRTAVIDLRQHAVGLRDPGIGRGNLHGNRLAGFGHLGHDTVMLMDVEGHGEHLPLLLRAVILDNLGLEILPGGVEQPDDPSVETDAVHHLVKDLHEDFIHVGGRGQQRTQAEYALQKLIFV